MHNMRTGSAFFSILVFLLFFSVVHCNTTEIQVQKHIQVAHSTCEGTLHPELCVSTLSSFKDLASKSIRQIISSLVNHTVGEVRSSSRNCSGLRQKLRNLKILDKRALDDCRDLLGETVQKLGTTINGLSKSKIGYRRHCDLQTLLSGAMTNLYTCLDGFAYSKGNVRPTIQDGLFKISHHLSNSLAFLKKVPGVKISDKSEVFPGYGKMKDGFPSWLTNRDRKLLQAPLNASDINLVVAKDGSGHYTTVSEAVSAAPNSSSTRFVIYIKAGDYVENVKVGSSKTNLIFVGDGIGKTVITASRSVVDGWTTFQSATVAVEGDGFLAKGITTENTAGPSKNQAVALRNSADLSAFYNCSIVGYQDTLYVHSLRQFYGECNVYGTIDFVFGNAAAVLQNCSLYARKPNESQKNVFTAQGREDPNQNTGISILNCKIAAAEDLIPVKSTFQTYLGRPWKLYSRTVYLLSDIEDLIEPAGWLEWDGDFALSTLYYGEYNNRGAGSDTSGRVTWPGYKVITNFSEASQFTVANFIQGDEWLDSYGIPYYPNLS